MKTRSLTEKERATRCPTMKRVIPSQQFVKSQTQTLTDVDRPPLHLADLLDVIRLEDLHRRLDQLLRGRPRPIHAPSLLVDEVRVVGELDVEPNEIVLARDVHERAVVRM